MRRFVERTFVWTGGALFVGALATAAWLYILVLGRADPPLHTRAGALTVDVLLFSAFALHHSVFARAGVKAWFARAVPDRLVRSIYVWVASALLIAVCVFWRPIGGVIYQAPAWGRAVLTFAQLVGVVFIWRAVRVIDPLELAGIHGPGSPATLQITGPYHFVRHPIYLGWMLMVFCPGTLTADRLVFAAVSAFYLVIAVPWEEASLDAEFGARYSRYKRRVPWRVIPYIY